MHTCNSPCSLQRRCSRRLYLAGSNRERAKSLVHGNQPSARFAASRWICGGAHFVVNKAKRQQIRSRAQSPEPQGQGPLFESYDDISNPPELPEPEAALLLVACGIGLVTGSSVVAFNWGIHEIRDFMDYVLPVPVAPGARALAVPYAWPNLLALPVVGALLVGLVKALMEILQAQKATTTGIARRIRRAAIPALKTSSAAITLGTGNSLGPEGPSVELGRTVAKGLGGFLRSKDTHFTSLIAAGSAAGVAAGFNAPISGVFFAIETVLAKRPKGDPLADQEEDEEDSGLTVAMLLLASVIAAIVSRAGLGSSPAFAVPDYQLQSLVELPMYALLGGLCGVTAVTFVWWSKASGDWFKAVRKEADTPYEEVLLPAVGGITTGVLALAYPEIMYQGFENVNKLLRLNGEYGAWLLIQIVAVKIFATGISKASGLVGGLYAPSIFLGAALGSAFSDIFHLLLDGVQGVALSAPQAYALVGVAAMLAAICQVPLTSVLLLFELTQDYAIIIPVLAAVGISYWSSNVLRKMYLAPATPSTPALPSFALPNGIDGGPPAISLSSPGLLLGSLEGQPGVPAPAVAQGVLSPVDPDPFLKAQGAPSMPTVQQALAAVATDTSVANLAASQVCLAPQASNSNPAFASLDMVNGAAASALLLGQLRLADCIVLRGDGAALDALMVLESSGKVGLVVDWDGAVVAVVTAAMLRTAVQQQMPAAVP